MIAKLTDFPIRSLLESHRQNYKEILENITSYINPIKICLRDVLKYDYVMYVIRPNWLIRSNNGDIINVLETG